MKHLKLFLLCGLGLFFAACNTSGQGIKTEKFTFEKETKHCIVNMSAELPVASDDDVCKTITSHLYSILGSVFSNNGFADLSPYDGNDMNSRAVTEYYFQNFFKKFSKSSDETAEESGDDYGEMQLEFDFSLEKGYETPLCVVFIQNQYSYAGGAHGFGFEKTYTFSKKDGRIVDEFLDSTRDLSSLQSVIRKGLCSYFETEPENLQDHLQIDVYEIPLPSFALYPSEEGIVFYYAQYEIAAYVDGAPCFTVPYDEIMPFLSKEARELLIGGKDATESEVAPARENAVSPIAKYLSLFDRYYELESEIRGLDEEVPAQKARMDKLIAEQEEIDKKEQELIEKNNDYKLTGADRQVFKNWANKYLLIMADKETITAWVDDCKTFSDVLGMLETYSSML